MTKAEKYLATQAKIVIDEMTELIVSAMHGSVKAMRLRLLDAAARLPEMERTLNQIEAEVEDE